jgi:hypothetical protein
MQENQMYENELKEANECISFLDGRLEELKAKCAMETRLKELPSKHLTLINLSYPSLL